MTLRLRPARSLRGAIHVPGDKSISHRAMILNGLARGSAQVSGFLPSEDCLRSIACMEAFGVEVERDPGGTAVIVHSPGRRVLHEAGALLDCGNSGTTIRLLAGVAAGLDGLTILDGDTSLRQRPMARVLQPLARMGVQVDGRAGGDLAPITLRGGRLRPFRGPLEVPSAQVKSAILLAALATDGPSDIQEIATTRNHTEIMLRAMGADVISDDRSVRLTPCERELEPLDLAVPGDLSAAAFWLVAGSVVPHSEIVLPGVGINPTRGGVLEILRRMGADIEVLDARTVSGEAVADLVVRSASLRGTVVAGDLVARSIDELPVLATAAAFADGVTEIRDAAELRLKESNRIRTTAVGLRVLGAKVEEQSDGLRIEGGRPLTGARVESGGDHRLAMSLAVAALAADGETELVGEETVAISYPGFWKHLEQLAGAEAFA